MEQGTEQRTEHAASRRRAENAAGNDEFNATALPSAPTTDSQNTERQTQNREKLQLLWGDLLQAAVREPGLILDAYSRFHGYSLGNRLAALVQCHARGIEPGPIHTYAGWRNLGYQVRSGEKALWLCMPLTRKVRDEGTAEKSHRSRKSQKTRKRAISRHPGGEGNKRSHFRFRVETPLVCFDADRSPARRRSAAHRESAAGRLAQSAGNGRAGHR